MAVKGWRQLGFAAGKSRGDLSLQPADSLTASSREIFWNWVSGHWLA
jgi:hypothetical protein